MGKTSKPQEAALFTLSQHYLHNIRAGDIVYNCTLGSNHRLYLSSVLFYFVGHLFCRPPIDNDNWQAYIRTNRVLQRAAWFMYLACEWRLTISLGGNSRNIAQYWWWSWTAERAVIKKADYSLSRSKHCGTFVIGFRLFERYVKQLDRRDTAMHVLSPFYWMLTKKVSQGLRGDCHP